MLLEQAQDYAFLLTAPDGTVTHWYPGAEHIFGYSAEEIVGQPLTRLFTEEDLARGEAQHELEVARLSRHSEDDRWHLRKDGSRFWSHGILVGLRDPAGGVAGYAKVLRDRTDVRTQIEALENKVAELAAAQDRTVSFLGTLAHELRNPLMPLAWAIELLRSDPQGVRSARIEVLAVIDRQVALLKRLVDDLMEMTRIGADKVELQMAVLDLTEVVKASADAVRERAEARKIELNVVSIAGPVHVCGDAQRLEQVFVNLLDNAVKYTSPAGQVLCQLHTEGADAVVRLKDNGIGISPEVLPRIFELFTQEDSSRPYARGGIGLGLPLVRELVRRHQGIVQARSEGRGKGSEFTVRLPLHEPK